MVAGRPSKEFFCPGSTLHAKFDTSNPLAYGMPAEGLVAFIGGSPAFEILPNDFNERYEIVVSYAERDLLQSGWLIGEAVPGEEGGDGLGQAGQRARGADRLPHAAPRPDAGTFKLLFNALIR